MSVENHLPGSLHPTAPKGIVTRMITAVATPAEMLAEAKSIEDGTHSFYTAATPAMLRRLAAKALRDRAEATK